jgi:hypothetical protein
VTWWSLPSWQPVGIQPYPHTWHQVIELNLLIHRCTTSTTWPKRWPWQSRSTSASTKSSHTRLQVIIVMIAASDAQQVTWCSIQSPRMIGNNLCLLHPQVYNINDLAQALAMAEEVNQRLDQKFPPTAPPSSPLNPPRSECPSVLTTTRTGHEKHGIMIYGDQDEPLQ